MASKEYRKKLQKATLETGGTTLGQQHWKAGSEREWQHRGYFITGALDGEAVLPGNGLPLAMDDWIIGARWRIDWREIVQGGPETLQFYVMKKQKHVGIVEELEDASTDANVHGHDTSPDDCINEQSCLDCLGLNLCVSSPGMPMEFEGGKKNSKTSWRNTIFGDATSPRTEAVCYQTKQVPQKPTHIAQNDRDDILDIFLYKNAGKLSNPEVLQELSSDLLPILLQIGPNQMNGVTVTKSITNWQTFQQTLESSSKIPQPTTEDDLPEPGSRKAQGGKQERPGCLNKSNRRTGQPNRPNTSLVKSQNQGEKPDTIQSHANTRSILKKASQPLPGCDPGRHQGSSIAALNTIKGTKRKKAPGHDGISNEVLKKLPTAIIENLTTVANAIMYLQCFPNTWKKAIVVLVPKKRASRKLLKSYRPISLLHMMAKVMERCILHHIQDTIEDKKVLLDEQHGFRPDHGTNTLTTRLTTRI
ncbi:hypothetical protein D910_05618 [Dendroctonus ponderosae]|uniref:Reverse transcriptase domain-containing protein n=1 Tax=Dendroctonus ponderosae TaxID=77166 RepID=U4UE70_DENPD|nr:hypothetical protein D910_05618 [Dendroctonus ponderosae]